MKNSQATRKKAVLSALMIVIIVAICIFANTKSYSHMERTSSANKDMTLAGELSAVSNTNSNVYCWEDAMLEVQGGKLHVNSMSGGQAWGQQVSSPVSKIINAGSNIAIIDNNKTMTGYSKQGKQLWSYSLPYEASDVFTDQSGMLLVEYKGDKGSIFEVLNSKGVRIANVSIENAYVLSFAVGNGNTFSVSVIDVSGDIVKSKVITYNGKGEIIWADNFDNEIIPQIKYNKNNTLMAIGEKNLYLYKSDGKKGTSVSLKGNLINVGISDEAIVVLSQELGKNICHSYDMRLKEIADFELDKSMKNVYIYKSRLILYSSDIVAAYNLKGNILAAYRKITDISNVYMTDENTILVVSNRKLQKLTFN